MMVLVVAFPFLLMLLMLLMERVEGPLRRDEVGGRLEAFLDTARPEEIETFVREGFAPALDRYWRRRRRTGRLGALVTNRAK